MIVTIITITYNDSEGLRRTIDSVRCQTCRDYQFIVMDGGSLDETKEVISDNEDIIYYWESKRDGGPFFGMNDAIKHSNGDYCIFMNSGDSFHDEFVIDKFCKANPCEDILTGVAAEHVNGIVRPWQPAKEQDFSLRWFYRHSLSHQSSFIRTALLKSMEYDTEFRIVADWLFFMNALLIHNCTYRELPFYVSHYMDGGISRDAGKAFAERDRAIVKYYGNRILRDCHTMQYGVNRWDSLAKKVAPESKIGKVLCFIVECILKLKGII